jgi:hypothetical protein
MSFRRRSQHHDGFANARHCRRQCDRSRLGVHSRHDFTPERLCSAERRISRDSGVHFAERLGQIAGRERFARLRKVQQFLE